MKAKIKRKHEFVVKLEETLVYSFKVEAVDEDEARDMISDMLYNDELILEDGERISTNITVKNNK